MKALKVLLCSIFLLIATGCFASLATEPVEEGVEITDTTAKPGMWLIVPAFCGGAKVDEKFMKRFIEHMMIGGMRAYEGMILSSNLPCYDTRLLEMKPVAGKLVKRLWKFEDVTGEELVLWEFKDSKDVRGYLWMDVK